MKRAILIFTLCLSLANSFAQVVLSRATLDALWIHNYKPIPGDYQNVYQSFVNIHDDFSDNSVLCKLPSSNPVGLNLTANTVLGRLSSGNIVAIPFSRFGKNLFAAGPGINIVDTTISADSNNAIWNAKWLHNRLISPAAPSNHQVLKWNSGLAEWTPATDTGTAYLAGGGITISGSVISADSNTGVWNANKLKGKAISPTAPTNNQVLKWNNGLSEWTAATDTNTTYTASTGLTLTGTAFSANTSSALWNANQLQGKAISPTSPTNNQILKYNNGLSEWTAATDTGIYTWSTGLANASGTITATTTNAIWNANKAMGFAISPATPSNHQVLKYNSGLSEWTPATDTGGYIAGVGLTIAGTNIYANNASGIWNANQLQYLNISPTAPSDKQILKWSAALNEWIPAKDTGLYTWSTGMTLTGTTVTANTTSALWNASQLQGKAISPTAPTNNQVLKYNNGLGEWTAATDTGIYTWSTGMTNTSGTITANTGTALWNANKLQGLNVSLTAPSNKQVLKYNSGLSEWTPATDTGQANFIQSGTPTVAAGTGIGSVSLATGSNNTAGKVTINVTSSAPNNPMISVAFSASGSFPHAAVAMITPADAGTAAVFGSGFYTVGTTTSFTINNVTNIASPETLNFYYIFAGY